MMQTLRQYETGTTPRGGSGALHGSRTTALQHGLEGGGTVVIPHSGSGATPALLHGSLKVSSTSAVVPPALSPTAGSHGDPSVFYWLECLATGGDFITGGQGAAGASARRTPTGAALSHSVALMGKIHTGQHVIDKVSICRFQALTLLREVLTRGPYLCSLTFSFSPPSFRPFCFTGALNPIVCFLTAPAGCLLLPPRRPPAPPPG